MKHCLVVDDSGVVRKVARRILENCGYRVDEAEGGLEALELCRMAMPDAVLLDWSMQDIDSSEWLRKFRGMPGGTAPKIVFCTTEYDAAALARAMHAGADDYLMKPFDRAQFEAKFQEIGLI